jgi:hypothetical protein
MLGELVSQLKKMFVIQFMNFMIVFIPRIVFMKDHMKYKLITLLPIQFKITKSQFQNLVAIIELNLKILMEGSNQW